MVDLFRNIIAFVATFTVVMTVTMIVISFLFHSIGYITTNPSTEAITFVAGLIMAILLIPFYHYPCQ